MCELSKPIYRLENWGFTILTNSLYQPPELGTPVLVGQVYDHPSRQDGNIITTSRIVGYNKELDAIETHNSFYKIGEPDEKYEAMVPDDKNRLIEIIQKNND